MHRKNVRVSRARVRLVGATIGLGLVALGTFSVLLTEEAPRGSGPVASRAGVAPVVGRPGTAPVPSSSQPYASQPDGASATIAPVPTRAGLPPASIRDLLERQQSATADDLAAWATDRGAHPNVRYTALRRLEAIERARSVVVATSLLGDRSPLLRENAIALLVRSQTPAARDALARLSGRDEQLARRLAAVRR